MSGTSTTIDLDTETQEPLTGGVVVLDNTPGAVIDVDAELSQALPARAIRNDDRSITLPLMEAITVTIKKDGVERQDKYASLTFHRLKGADITAIQAASKTSAPTVLLARSARIREPIMNAIWKEMDAADIADASKIVESFFESGPTTPK